MPSPLEQISLACPLDGLALSKSPSGFLCAKNHCYDIARQGYVNLLPVQLKASRQPGDSKSMVAARRDVLEGGYFSALADTVADSISLHTGSLAETGGLIVDAGCGEGYYTAKFSDRVSSDTGSSSIRVLGIDVSKWSVLSAAKKYNQVAFAVATNKRLPVISGTADIITSLFGFETWQPWASLQTAGQIVIVVGAGPKHLLELRRQIYPEIRSHTDPSDAQAQAAGYTRVDSRVLNYSVTVNSPKMLHSILTMTPHGHRATPDALNNIQQLHDMQLEIDTIIRVYRRR